MHFLSVLSHFERGILIYGPISSLDYILFAVPTITLKCHFIHHLHSSIITLCINLLCLLPNISGYAEETTVVVYGTSSCYYNCTADVSMAPQCRNYTNITVTSSPSTANQSILIPNGLNYNISDLQRCQRYTVEVTAQVGAHKYTNQTQVTVMLRKSA